MSEEQYKSGFLNRWSARKLELEKAATEPLANDQLANDQNEQIIDTRAVPESTPRTDFAPGAETGQASQDVTSTSRDKEANQINADEPLLSDADMPPIESLNAHSDISDFLNKGVSAALRRAALRHVFQQPEYNIRDGLNDYDGDYTVFEPLGDTVTSDMKWHIARKERDRLAAEARARELELQSAESSDELTQSTLEEQDSLATEENSPDVKRQDEAVSDSPEQIDDAQESDEQRLAEAVDSEREDGTVLAQAASEEEIGDQP